MASRHEQVLPYFFCGVVNHCTWDKVRLASFGKLLAVRLASLIEFIEATCKAANINNHTGLLDYIKYTKLPVNYGHALVYMNETKNAHFTRYDNTADIVPVVKALISDLAATWSTDGQIEPYTTIQFKRIL